MKGNLVRSIYRSVIYPIDEHPLYGILFSHFCVISLQVWAFLVPAATSYFHFIHVVLVYSNKYYLLFLGNSFCFALNASFSHFQLFIILRTGFRFHTQFSLKAWTANVGKTWTDYALITVRHPLSVCSVYMWCSGSHSIGKLLGKVLKWLEQA